MPARAPPGSIRRSSRTSRTSSPASATSSASAIIFGQRRRRGGPQRGADLRYDLEISFEESATGTETVDPDSARRNVRDLQGIGRGGRHVAGNLQSVPRLRSASISAGFPHGRTAVPELPRHRQDDREAVSDVPWRRARRARTQTDGQDSRGHRDRSADATLRRRRTRIRRRSSGRSLRRRPRAGAFVLPSRRRRPLLRDADQLSRRSRSAERSTCRRSTDASRCTCQSGTQPGARFKLRGKGMPHVNGRGHGDLYVIARVAVPKKLSKEQKHAARRTGPHAAAGEARRRGRRRREAVLRTRQRYLWVACIGPVASLCSLRPFLASAITPRWISRLPRVLGREPSRTCSTPSSMHSSRWPFRNTTPATAGAFSSAPSLSATRSRRAGVRVRQRALPLAAIEVDDEDWARRSQASLTAVRVGRIVVAPPWDVPDSHDRDSPKLRPPDKLDSRANSEPRTANREDPARSRSSSTRPPASAPGITRRRDCASSCCSVEVFLEARVIDVGTGSGVLALAAWKLGAAHVVAIDNDPDALQNARDNVVRNGASDAIEVGQPGSIERLARARRSRARQPDGVGPSASRDRAAAARRRRTVSSS